MQRRFHGAVSGAEQFGQLSPEEQTRHLEASQQLTGFALDHAVPVFFAPPWQQQGKVNGATCSILRLGSEIFVLTASHVLEEYENRSKKGEILNWQVGRLPPFDPTPRIVWRDREKDIVMLRISGDELRRVGRCLTFGPLQWPPCIPKPEQLVLAAGYPKALREMASDRIGAGPFSALFRVTTVGEGYCKCRIEHRDLVNFSKDPMPAPGTDIGGVSGGPVLLVEPGYPLVGVITQHYYMESADLEILQFATLADVKIQTNHDGP